MQTKPRYLVYVLALILSVGLIAAGCGDDDGGSGDTSEDPQAILEQTFNNDEMIESGVLDLSVQGEAEGAEGGSVDLSLSGPFANNGSDELPTLDWSLELSVDGGPQQIDFSGGLVIVDGKAFVNYQDTDYEIDEATLEALKQQADQSSGGEGQQSLERYGVDPIDWFTNLANEGTEDLDGTETIHISGDLDIAKVVEDFVSIAEQTGQAGQVDSAELDQVTEAFEEASFDLFTTAEDKQLRKLDGTLALTPPDGSGDGVDQVDLTFSIAITDVGTEPDVSAPEDARPIGELFGELGGLGALGGLGGGGTPPGDSGDEPATEAPSDSDGATDTDPSGGAGGASSPEDAQQNLDCLENAQTEEELGKCLEGIQP